MVYGRKKMIITVISAIFVIFMFLIGKWLLILFGLVMLEEPEKPQITKQDFSFTLIYSIDGKRKKIQDTLLCEFDGIGIDEARGKYRKWKGTLKSGKEKIIIWEGSDKKGTKQNIYYNIPTPGYYMGDPYYKDGNKFNYSDIVLRSEVEDEEGSFEGFISEKNFLRNMELRL